MPDRDVASTRVVVALFVAALLVAEFFGVEFGITSFKSEHAVKNPALAMRNALAAGVSITLLVTPASLVGLFVIAGPCWQYLHERNRRKLWHAMVFGAALAFVASFGLLTGGFDGASHTLHGATNADRIWT